MRPNYKLFYKELGKLLYAAAKADGTIRKKETSAVKDFISNELLALEPGIDKFGTDNAFYTEFEFDTLVENDASEVSAFRSFLSYLQTNFHSMDEHMLSLSEKSVERVAASYKGINHAEEYLIDTLKKEIRLLKDGQPFKKIIVPVDYSSCAENAAIYAMSFGEGMNAVIALMHAQQPVTIPTDSPVDSISLLNAENKNQKKYLHDFCHELMRKSGKEKIKNIDSFIHNGSVVESITKISAEQKADLIIMGTRGASGIKEFLVGSNTAKVIEKAHIPVMAIPENSTYRKIRKIVYATNFNDSDFKAIIALAKIAAWFDAELFITHILEEGRHEYNEKELLEWFQELVEEKTGYRNISYKSFMDQDVLNGLDRFIISEHIDLVAMSTHRRSFVEKLVGSSITKKMAYHSHVPLLAFHA